MSLKKKTEVIEVSDDLERFRNDKSLKKIKIPATGVTLSSYTPPDEH